MWAVLHERGDGEDKPLSQRCPLQELTGNISLPHLAPGASLVSVSEFFFPSTTWRTLTLRPDLTPPGFSTWWLPPVCSQSASPLWYLERFIGLGFFVSAFLSRLSNSSLWPMVGADCFQKTWMCQMQISLCFCSSVQYPCLLE